jgi:hypothetical protein
LQLQLAPRKLDAMTLAHHAPTLHAPDLASALDALRARGLRISASRRQVLETLYADSRPRTAEELAKDGDLASVYRPRFTHFPIVGVCATCQEDEGHAHP